MILTIIVFILILSVLVFVHEFGHFIVAKKSGMAVEEFGFGFPPRLIGVQKVNGKWKVVWWNRKQDHPDEQYAVPGKGSPPGESRPRGSNLLSENTIYSINLIPLGGFVKIRGENNEYEDDPKSFVNKGFLARFLTLVAGVVMNWLLAAVIFSIVIGIGTTTEIGPNMPAGAQISNRQVAITDILPDSPANKAGLQVNDFILSLDGQKFTDVDDTRNYIVSNEGKTIAFEVQRVNEVKKIEVQTLANPSAGQGPTGISITNIANVKLPWPTAIKEGFIQTYNVTGAIVGQLGQLFTTKKGFQQVGGPVAIGRLVGQVRQLGIVPLLNLTALLSLSLAVLNIMPFPALDGGRVLFLIIEKIRRKKNNQKVEQFFNTAGFVFLLLLMLVVTIKDIVKK